LDGVTVNPPLQIVVLIGVISGLGLIATTTLKAVPGHNPVDGVTEYVTLYVVFVGFSTVPNMLSLAVV
jgi:hypothetical protein